MSAWVFSFHASTVGSALSRSRPHAFHFANRALVTSAHPQCAANAAGFRLRQVALIFTLACAAAPFTFAQEARLFVSSRAGDRLTEKPAVRFVLVRSGPATFRLDPSVSNQTIVGFGASFLEAGMVCLNSLEPDQQEAILRALFDPET